MTDPDHISNWRRVGARVTLSGDPTEAELAQIKAPGVTDIVDLGPHTNKGALPDKPGPVVALGLSSPSLPVDFDGPTDADFEAVCQKPRTLEGKAIHIHCIDNARASAFMTGRAQAGRGGDPAAVELMMDGNWRPGGVWARFMGRPEDAALPQRYTGEDT